MLPRLNVSQYDKGQTVAVTLNNGSVPFSLPSGATVYVSGTKADNTGFEYACSTSGGLSFAIKDQMTVFAGEVTCELSIYQGNNRLSTINFILNVEKAALDEDTEISQTDIPIIENIPQYVTQAANSANLAHQWATGGGSDTPSASNNAKYWAQQAAQTDIGRATTVDYSTDQSTYSFRRCTHNAVYDKLVGISWVENQLVQNGNFASASGWTPIYSTMSVASNKCTMTIANANKNARIYRTINAVAGHKYYICADITLSVANSARFVINEADVTALTSVSANTKTRVFGVTVATTGNNRIDVRPFNGSNPPSVGDTAIIENFMCVDLTLMFSNPAIADKIYAMEQATAGSGLAWIRQYGFLDGKYIEHNVGQIKSAIPKWRKVVGKNLLHVDEVILNTSAGGVCTPMSNGYRVQNTVSTQSAFNKLKFKLSANVAYTLTADVSVTAGDAKMLIRGYDASGNLTNIAQTSSRNHVSLNFTPSEKFAYYELYLYSTGSTAAIGDVTYANLMIRFSDETDDTYEPYTSVTYPLGSDELRGVPTLSGNNLVADGDVKTSDGVVNRKYWKETFTSCASVALDSTSGLYYTTFTLAKTSVNGSNKLLANLSHTYKFPIQATLGSLYVTGNGSVLVYFNVDQTKTTKSAADTYFTSNPLDVIYPLATPTTSVSTPFTSPQVSLVTEETDTPCGHDSVVVDIPEWMRNQYFDDVRAEASKVQGLERDLGEIECDKTTAGTYTLSCVVDSSGNKTYSWA